MKKKLMLYPVLFIGMLSIFLIGCKKNSTVGSGDSMVPVVTLKPVTDITGTSAISGGVVTNAGDINLLDVGICWSLSSNPTISDNKISCFPDSANFLVTIQGLIPNYTYYVRAFATDSAGIAYSKQSSFTTPKTAPFIITADLTNVTDNTATCGGNVFNDGGGEMTARGVCWSTHFDPTVADSKTIDGAGTGSFSSSITGLTAGTIYYIRAYATNNIGTTYGGQVMVNCPGPAISTINSSLTGKGYKCTYSITSVSVSVVIARGVCVSTLPNPTLANSNYSNDGTGLGSFTSNEVPITLINNTTYYLRAYATNYCGTFYGNQVTCNYYCISDACGCH